MEFLTEDQVLDFIRNYLLGRLVRVTPALLADHIQQQTHIWESFSPGYKRFLTNSIGGKTARTAYQKYAGMITAEQVVKWMLNPYP